VRPRRDRGPRLGIIANNGPINPDGATKAAQFIQLCCQSGTPILYLQNTTGYMVGTAAERAGMVKHGSKMIQAVANATVPQITLIIGGSFGAGNYGMCGRSYDPRFVFAWPGSRIAVMGGEQAAKVMEIITVAKFARMGVNPTPTRSPRWARRSRTSSTPSPPPLRHRPPVGRRHHRPPRQPHRPRPRPRHLPRGRRPQLRPNTFGVARL
jgi:geranyl-CoA carboxylase beta subunit